MPSENKSLHEAFTCFFENPTRDGLRKLLQNNFGETNQLDFKQDWGSFPTLARHILAIANSGGGCIVFGITQKDDKSLEATGLTVIQDKVDVASGFKKFLPTQLKHEVLDFSYIDSEYATLIGKKFQVVVVFDLPEYLPFVSGSESTDIKRTAVYVRRGTASEEANYEELQKLMNRRIQTGYSTQSEFDLNKELQELKILYGQINRAISAQRKVFIPEFPQEEYEDFIVRMIKLKKQRIESIIEGKI
jgi:predicted HTH transcriptional regulator